MPQFRLDDAVELPSISADPLEEGGDDAVALAEQRRQQVQRIDLRMALVGRQRLRAGECLLGLDRKFIETESHDGFSFCRCRSSAHGWLVA